jgi:hypothetical protein
LVGLVLVFLRGTHNGRQETVLTCAQELAYSLVGLASVFLRGTLTGRQETVVTCA